MLTRADVDKLARNLIFTKYEKWAKRKVSRDAYGRFVK